MIIIERSLSQHLDWQTESISRHPPNHIIPHHLTVHTLSHTTSYHIIYLTIPYCIPYLIPHHLISRLQISYYTHITSTPFCSVSPTHSHTGHTVALYSRHAEGSKWTICKRISIQLHQNQYKSHKHYS